MFVFLSEIIVSLAVARGSCVMSSRQSSRADLGGIPEGDPIENKVCFLFICLLLFLLPYAVLFWLLFCFNSPFVFVEAIYSNSVSHLF